MHRHTAVGVMSTGTWPPIIRCKQLVCMDKHTYQAQRPHHHPPPPPRPRRGTCQVCAQQCAERSSTVVFVPLCALTATCGTQFAHGFLAGDYGSVLLCECSQQREERNLAMASLPLVAAHSCLATCGLRHDGVGSASWVGDRRLIFSGVEVSVTSLPFERQSPSVSVPHHNHLSPTHVHHHHSSSS